MGGSDPKVQATEFDEIEQLFLPATCGAPEALGLKDDAAVIPSRPGFDLVVTKDAIVAGVHALADEAPADLARKLLRVNLSDLAAKGAEPYGAFLAVAWPTGWSAADRRAFAEALALDCMAFGLSLFGGDTVSTPGPFTASLTLMGWVPAGGMVMRSGAQAGDWLLVSGVIGDGGLGLMAVTGKGDFSPAHQDHLAAAYRTPEPQLVLGGLLQGRASAAVDVSDGLVADAGHLARASGLGLDLWLEHLPLSEAGQDWLTSQPDRQAALSFLATAGDDYQIVCTAPPTRARALIEAARTAGVALRHIGLMTDTDQVTALLDGQPVALTSGGWSHL
jgi:thiamine-monophosphate kinase